MDADTFSGIGETFMQPRMRLKARGGLGAQQSDKPLRAQPRATQRGTKHGRILPGKPTDAGGRVRRNREAIALLVDALRLVCGSGGDSDWNGLAASVELEPLELDRAPQSTSVLLPLRMS